MRFDGTLKKWNADRSLGFVIAALGSFLALRRQVGLW